MESSTATTTTTIPPKSPHSLRDFFTRESRSGSFKTLEKVIDLLNLSSRTVNTANSSQPEERVRRGDFNVSFAEPIHEVVYTATEPLQDHERTLYFYNVSLESHAVSLSDTSVSIFMSWGGRSNSTFFFTHALTHTP